MRLDSAPRTLVVCAAAMVALSCFSERTVAPDTTGADLCGPAPGAGVIQIRDFGFHPATLEVSAGAQVTWVNCDPDAHTSTADAGQWDSGLLAQGSVYRRSFDQAGRFAYHCEPHLFMTAAVVVR